MGPEFESEQQSNVAMQSERHSSVGLAIALAALAAVGAGIAVQQMLDRRLSRPERARLRFYRYLRERGHLES